MRNEQTAKITLALRKKTVFLKFACLPYPQKMKPDQSRSSFQRLPEVIFSERPSPTIHSKLPHLAMAFVVISAPVYVIAKTIAHRSTDPTELFKTFVVTDIKAVPTINFTTTSRTMK